ncbi:hypothetical protein OHV05_28055 [Kitasatospora sp. NBC_00070]|uniref:hypothetical protein n=1 Tax=Kitasatospora sp. NBC_00070 TaxID=2975962 RepID=UPI0032532A5C
MANSVDRSERRFVLRLNRRHRAKPILAAMCLLLGTPSYLWLVWPTIGSHPPVYHLEDILFRCFLLMLWLAPAGAAAVVGLADTVRPARLTLRPDGIEVRTPLLPSRFLSWRAISGVDALTVRSAVASQLLVLEIPVTRRQAAGRPGRSYQRLLVVNRGLPGSQGLAFDDSCYDVHAVDVVTAVQAIAPSAVRTADYTGTPVHGSTLD